MVADFLGSDLSGQVHPSLQALLSALKTAGVTIDAVEFGNEDDSYYYDADVPQDHQATPAELHTWLRGYGEFLKAGAEVLHDPRVP